MTTITTTIAASSVVDIEADIATVAEVVVEDVDVVEDVEAATTSTVMDLLVQRSLPSTPHTVIV